MQNTGTSVRRVGPTYDPLLIVISRSLPLATAWTGAGKCSLTATHTPAQPRLTLPRRTATSMPNAFQSSKPVFTYFDLYGRGESGVQRAASVRRLSHTSPCHRE